MARAGGLAAEVQGERQCDDEFVIRIRTLLETIPEQLVPTIEVDGAHQFA